MPFCSSRSLMAARQHTASLLHAIAGQATAARRRTLALSIAAPLALLLNQPDAAKAININVNGTGYDVELYTGTYDANNSYFGLPPLGRMPWWGNENFALDASDALADGLGVDATTGDGPLFAYAFIGGDVSAAYYNGGLSQTDTTLNRTATYGWVVLTQSQPVPAPAPLLGAAAAFSASRRLRLRIQLTRGPGPRTVARDPQLNTTPHA